MVAQGVDGTLLTCHASPEIFLEIKLSFLANRNTLFGHAQKPHTRGNASNIQLKMPPNIAAQRDILPLWTTLRVRACARTLYVLVGGFQRYISARFVCRGEGWAGKGREGETGGPPPGILWEHHRRAPWTIFQFFFLVLGGVCCTTTTWRSICTTTASPESSFIWIG